MQEPVPQSVPVERKLDCHVSVKALAARAGAVLG